jgi:hypothetical protein
MSDDRQTRWRRHYDIADHLGWDLRMIADQTDAKAEFPTMDAAILRRAAECFDGLPESTSHEEALRLAREKLAKPA